MERQIPRRFGCDYIPSIFATREEAPSKSRPAKIRSLHFHRVLHALGEPELYAIFLAMFNPGVIDIHEQRMLDRFEAPHPLFGMPNVDATALPAVKGTVVVADRLNCLDLHPSVAIKSKLDNSRVQVVFPLIGDLLLFIQMASQIYCVNWNVKDVESAFYQPKIKGNIPTEREEEWAIFRPRIESELYCDAEIRTVQVSLERIDKELRRNLARAAIISEQKYVLDVDIEQAIIHALIDSIQQQIPPLEVFLSFARRGLCPLNIGKKVLYKAIWDRVLKPDLFHPILEDYPLRPEQRDPLDVYSDWFKK
jgi:hypothetical protein